MAVCYDGGVLIGADSRTSRVNKDNIFSFNLHNRELMFQVARLIKSNLFIRKYIPYNLV